MLKTISKRKVEFRKWKKESWQESKSKMMTWRLILTQINRCILNSINLLSLKEQSKQKQELRNSCKTIKCLRTAIQNLRPLFFLHVTLSPNRGKTLLTSLTRNRLISNNLVLARECSTTSSTKLSMLLPRKITKTQQVATSSPSQSCKARLTSKSMAKTTTIKTGNKICKF